MCVREAEAGAAGQRLAIISDYQESFWEQQLPNTGRGQELQSGSHPGQKRPFREEGITSNSLKEKWTQEQKTSTVVWRLEDGCNVSCDD